MDARPLTVTAPRVAAGVLGDGQGAAARRARRPRPRLHRLPRAKRSPAPPRGGSLDRRRADHQLRPHDQGQRTGARPPARRLVERLHGAAQWEERFALLDAFLARRLLAAAAPHPAILHAWRRIVATDGRVAVSRLTGEVGWSRRHLASRFRAEIGLPPKALARIVRFHRVTDRLRAGEAGDLARVAQECGYYDQSHLNRDFRAFADLTPTAFATRLLPGGAGVAASAEEVTFLQDASGLAA